jgi:hypothetical protein
VTHKNEGTQGYKIQKYISANRNNRKF